MAEYIEREALRDALYDADAITMEGVKILNQFPAADVEPVRHGRWINERMLVGGFAEKWGCDCSECGKTIEEPLWKPNYCPNCGAKMDKEDDE